VEDEVGDGKKKDLADREGDVVKREQRRGGGGGGTRRRRENEEKGLRGEGERM
jgi:hypothetical protein